MTLASYTARLETEADMTSAEQLISLRNRYGLTQQELADILRIKVESIQRREAPGGRTSFAALFLIRLAVRLAMSLRHD